MRFSTVFTRLDHPVSDRRIRALTLRFTGLSRSWFQLEYEEMDKRCFCMGISTVIAALEELPDAHPSTALLLSPVPQIKARLRAFAAWGESYRPARPQPTRPGPARREWDAEARFLNIATIPPDFDDDLATFSAALRLCFGIIGERLATLAAAATSYDFSRRPDCESDSVSHHAFSPNGDGAHCRTDGDGRQRRGLLAPDDAFYVVSDQVTATAIEFQLITALQGFLIRAQQLHASSAVVITT